MSRTIECALVAGVALLLAACSSEKTVTTTVVSTAAVSTSLAVSTSSSTAPATTTSTSVTVSTIAATTTVDLTAATKAAVASAVVQARQDYLYALVNVDAPDAQAVLGRTTAANSPSWDLSTQNIDQVRSSGWRARLNPTIPSVTTVESDVELLDGPPATRAQVTVCTVDSPILYEPGSGPDGSDTIVNDQVLSRRNRVTMVLDDGAWKMYEGAALGSWDGAGCPAE